MDVDVLVVRKLEDIAFDVTYKTVLGNLILCHEHRPDGKQVPWLPFASILSTNLCLSSENVCKLVRHYLDRKLFGTMGEKVRGQYVKRFYEDSFNRKKVCSLVDIWVFFNCVLDDNIKELKIHSTFPDSELNLQLIPTIAYWSPLLTELYIDFQLMKRTGDGTERLKLVITSMSSLQHLTDLTMLGLKRKERYCALSLIGTSCPSLTSFAVNAAFMDKKDILAFILGEFANVLLDSEEEPPWCEDVALQDLVIPSELRTPVCSKLREFLIIARFYDTENYCRISKYAAAFALRNLPLLQKMSVRIPTSLAVELIDGTTEEAKVSQVANMFAKSCREAAKRVENISVHESLKRSSLSGRLMLLKRLNFVNVRSDRMLKAVGELCPLLEKASFCAQSFLNEQDYFEGVEIEPKSIASPENLSAILRKWPKLSKLKLIDLSPEYVKPILEVFGPHLRHLKLTACPSIKLTDLAACHQLESLKFCLYSRLDPKEGDVTLLDPEEDASALIDSNTFLPNLKKLRSDGCLGVYSAVFEKKATLVHLDLMCSHVGMEVCGSRSDWCRIPQLWSRLETLAVRQYAGFSMDMISDLIPQLHNLKTVVLPQRISSFNPVLFASLKNHLSNRMIPAEISINNFYVAVTCPVVERE